MPPAPVSWRAVAEPPDLANVAGPRVRFLCLDVTDAHVVLGANTGSVYVFARTRATGEDAASPFGPDADPPEGPMRFLTMVSPADAPPIDPPDGAAPTRRNITPAISRLRLNPDGTLCAGPPTPPACSRCSNSRSTPSDARAPAASSRRSQTRTTGAK